MEQTHWHQANTHTHTYNHHQLWYTYLHKPNVFGMLPETSSTQIQTVFTNEAVTVLTTTTKKKGQNNKLNSDKWQIHVSL